MMIHSFIRTLAGVVGVSLSTLFNDCYAIESLNLIGVDSTKVGIYIEDLRTGEVIASANANTPLIPASVRKSLTAASTYSKYSPTDCLITNVYTTGNIHNGVLTGNLVIKTVGDPTIESEHFPDNLGFADSIVVALQCMNVIEIAGKVIVDESAVKNQPTPKSWMAEDLSDPYGAGTYATNYKDNTLSLVISTGEIIPNTPGVKIKRGDEKGKLLISLKRGDKRFVVSGTNTEGDTVKVANPLPQATMRYEVTKKLQDANIKIDDKRTKEGNLPGMLIYAHKSPEMSEILKSLMYRSDNMMAEGMLRHLAPGKTRQEALKLEQNIWRNRGVNLDNIVLKDGSGLSRRDRLTPALLGEMYRWMYKSGQALDYIKLFPKAGQDGTMQHFMNNTPLAGRLATKTGSMRGIQCFGGYMLNDAGRPTHSIVILVNDFKGSRDYIKWGIGEYLMNLFQPSQDGHLQ